MELNGTMEVDAPALSAYARGRLGVRGRSEVFVEIAEPLGGGRFGPIGHLLTDRVYRSRRVAPCVVAATLRL